jgi:hypothetical protein
MIDFIAPDGLLHNPTFSQGANRLARDKSDRDGKRARAASRPHCAAEHRKA